jgi:fucose 4-O-acetylase-like acetyltransferase
MALMIVQPVMDLYIRSSPARIHSPAWRLALISGLSGVVSAPILGLFFMFAIAVIAEDRGMSYLVSSLSALAMVVCLAATGTFALDALQMRGQVQASLSESYGLESSWVALKLILSVIALAVISMSALRAARRTRRPASQLAGKASTVVTGPAGRPSVAMRPTADAESR